MYIRVSSTLTGIYIQKRVERRRLQREGYRCERGLIPRLHIGTGRESSKWWGCWQDRVATGMAPLSISLRLDSASLRASLRVTTDRSAVCVYISVSFYILSVSRLNSPCEIRRKGSDRSERALDFRASVRLYFDAALTLVAYLVLVFEKRLLLLRYFLFYIFSFSFLYINIFLFLHCVMLHY